MCAGKSVGVLLAPHKKKNNSMCVYAQPICEGRTGRVTVRIQDAKRRLQALCFQRVSKSKDNTILKFLELLDT